MKTLSNNPSVKIGELSIDQRKGLFQKMSHMSGNKLLDFIMWTDSEIDNSFEFFITSPTSVSVKKK